MINFSNDLKEQVGLRFKKFRTHLGLTQTEMADKLNLDQTTIGGIEKAKSFPTIPVILILHENWNLCIEWLLTGKGAMLNEPSDNSSTIYTEIFSKIPMDNEMITLLRSLEIPFIRDFLIAESYKLKKIFESKIDQFYMSKESGVNEGQNHNDDKKKYT